MKQNYILVEKIKDDIKLDFLVIPDVDDSYKFVGIVKSVKNREDEFLLNKKIYTFKDEIVKLKDNLYVVKKDNILFYMD